LGGSPFEVNLEKKLARSSSQPIAEHGGLCLSFQDTWEADIKELWFQASPVQKKKKFMKPHFICALKTKKNFGIKIFFNLYKIHLSSITFF
jgi:hypothetical protein